MSEPLLTSSGVLEIDELAYLLASVSAQKIVGFDESVFVEANIERGLQVLREHDWLVAKDQGWSLNPALYLLAAILAAPERAMTVVLHDVNEISDDVSIAYYEAQGTIVEIRPTADGVKFTMADDNALISTRAAEIGGQLDVQQVSLPTLQVASAGFASAMKAPDRQARLEQLFSKSLPEAELTQVTAALISDIKVATVEGVGFVGRTLAIRKDLYCVGSPAVLVAGEQRPGTSIYISEFSTENFVEYLNLIWDVADTKTPDSELAGQESS